MNHSTHELRREGVYLFQAFFPGTPPTVLIDRYVEAHANLSMVPGSDTLMRTLVERNLDAQAVEFVLRLRTRMNPLTVKVGVICFLAETDGRLWRYFWTVNGSRAGAIWSVVKILWEAPLRFLKGVWLVRRYHLA